LVKKHQCGLGRSHIGQWIYPVKRHKLRKTRKMKREKVIDAVKELPQEFDLEELIERLIFVEKVEQGLKQFDEGKAVDHAQVKDMVKKW